MTKKGEEEKTIVELRDTPKVGHDDCYACQLRRESEILPIKTKSLFHLKKERHLSVNLVIVKLANLLTIEACHLLLPFISWSAAQMSCEWL